MIEFNDFCSVFNTIMALNGFSNLVENDKSRVFYDLTDRMLTVNEYMNLTAIKDPAAIILLHYADSLTAARFLPQNAKIADIGCGAGFPCLPLAICRPDLSILALDSTEKRIQYVKETAKLLSCENLEAIAALMQSCGVDYAELLPYNRMAGSKYASVLREYDPQFDTERAVASREDVFARHGIRVKIM